MKTTLLSPRFAWSVFHLATQALPQAPRRAPHRRARLAMTLGVPFLIGSLASGAAVAAPNEGSCAELAGALNRGLERSFASAVVRENGELTAELELAGGGLRRLFHRPVSNFEPSGGPVTQQFFRETGLLPGPHARCTITKRGDGLRQIAIEDATRTVVTLDAATGLPIRLDQPLALGTRTVQFRWGAPASGEESARSRHDEPAAAVRKPMLPQGPVTRI